MPPFSFAAQFAALAEKGRALHEQMVDGAQRNEYTAPRELSRPEGGYQTVFHSDHPMMLDHNTAQMMEEVGAPTEGYVQADVVNVPDTNHGAPPRTPTSSIGTGQQSCAATTSPRMTRWAPGVPTGAISWQSAVLAPWRGRLRFLGGGP